MNLSPTEHHSGGGLSGNKAIFCRISRRQLSWKIAGHGSKAYMGDDDGGDDIDDGDIGDDGNEYFTMKLLWKIGGHGSYWLKAVA